MECEIFTYSLKDSAANSKLKLLKEGETFGVEKPGGEKRLHIGSISEEQNWDSFFFPNGEHDCIMAVSKIDLIKYLFEAKNEYLNPSQSYRLNISDLYDGLYEQTLNIPNESFSVCFEKNTDSARYYLSRPSKNEFFKNYNYINDICLPIVTQYVFLRVKDGDSYIFYLKPEFKPNFSPQNTIGIDSIHGDNIQYTGDDSFNPLLTALRTKPFVLLAGISGTGKSRIVRELAKACWKQGDAEFGKNHPKNFRMVQVKPNWHDSSELIGYVSRINGEKYVVGPFLRFMAEAINDDKTPYFLCLDEMNLAPVEQYFAEYLSVIESRKLNADGQITTDPIIDFEHTEAYKSLIDQLFPNDDNLRNEYLKENGGKRLTIPQNLFVVGTVNMDETTFSFSRKVLDRAMTIEMNEVDLHGGLDANAANELGHIENLIPTSVEGKDVYAQNQDLCDKVLDYLAQVNEALDKTPFKIAYRTRNEFLVYAVNRGAENLTAALDEMTAMKILSRIEGDSDRTKKPLEALQNIVNSRIVAAIPEPEEGKPRAKSVSAEKIKEMQDKLTTGYTSFWS